MNILCIDYGTRRIGIAIAMTPLAEPLEVIANPIKIASQIVTPQALESVVRLIAKHEIEKVLVGISEEKMADQTREFIERLEPLVHIPIEEVDETLSTHEALQAMHSMKKSRREGPRDHIAAARMLQNYLDLHS
ncbi:MAG: Holliday junction resolvase RuvX [Candidatus Woesebacteria bacterium]